MNSLNLFFANMYYRFDNANHERYKIKKSKVSDI